MLQFNIELRTQDRVWDIITIERADHTELRIEVARFVGELLKDHAAQIWMDQDWRVDVTNQDGLLLYVMHLLVTNAAASQPMQQLGPTIGARG